MNSTDYIKTLDVLSLIAQRRTKGTSIAIFYETDEQKSEFSEALKDKFHQFIIKTLRIDTEDTAETFLQNLLHTNNSSTSEIVDKIILIDSIDSNPQIFQSLNMIREAFFKAFSRSILVFLINKNNIATLKFSAPDFWDWISYHLYLPEANQYNAQQNVIYSDEYPEEKSSDLEENFNQPQQDSEQDSSANNSNNHENSDFPPIDATSDTKQTYSD